MATTALCGKAPVGQIESMPQHGIHVVFATDPEGHLGEDVQTVPA